MNVAHVRFIVERRTSGDLRRCNTVDMIGNVLFDIIARNLPR